MSKVLFVIPSLDYGGSAKQLLLLAAGLAGTDVEPTVCVLGESTPWAEALVRHGVTVECLGWKRRLDVRPLVQLRDLVRGVRPDVVHAWQLPALRALAATVGLGTCRLIVSGVLQPAPRGACPAWWDRWLLKRVDTLTASGPTEVERGRRWGLPVERLVQVPPGVAGGLPEPAPAALYRELGIPVGARLLAGVGPLEPHKGFLEALWALDILRTLYDNVHLLLVGRGSGLARLAEFLGNAGLTGRVHFAQPELSVLPLLAGAEVVWAPSRREAGTNAILEAMALGKPVVATRLPGLAELVADGETGFLIEPGDKANLARRTHRLLEDPALRQRQGVQARERALRLFSAASLVERCERLYSSKQWLVASG